jgi:hypothetical protein
MIGPQLFFEKEAPSYSSGFLAMMICYSVAFSSCFALRFYLVWENKRRDRLASIAGEGFEEEKMVVNMADKTDKEMGKFRYVY